ncbi:MAG TPA: adenosylmethionine--8-amino-7-oxononanoate transaminase [Rhodanobacteraceae bacterium]|nr:adenosylmethionine--8-amino-7-oxononanoate transaminase [Rhodanobacteraceae bacterium]
MDTPVSNNHALAERDLRHVWHPCTQMHDHETIPMVPVVRGEGAWLFDADGRRYLDCVSSWWVNLFGHANPRIAAALTEQARTLEHVIFAGMTHPPAIELAERLVAVTPPGLERVFYADNGSSAIEIALKMSFHYWLNRGQGKRTRFMALSGGYHGETLGALSVSDVALYRKTYAPLLLEPLLVPSPDAYAAEPGESAEDAALRRLDDLRDMLEKHAHETCAVIVEPLVQCATGMRMYHPAYLVGLRKLCDEFNVHFIADEIAVGFGRTGTMFACEQADISPDFMCLSKGLTAGTMALSAVLTTEDVYAAFYDTYASGKAFLHSHSYTGNPLACRVALETLNIFRDEPVLERNRQLAAHMAAHLAPLRDHPHVADVRQTGMIAAIELTPDKTARTPPPDDWCRHAKVEIFRHGIEHECLLRPLGNVVYFMPPYVVDEADIDHMVDTAIGGIERALA